MAHVVAGLVFAENRQAGAEAGMRRAMASLRIADPAVLAQAVERPGAERDTVLAELTTGESYFFRDSAQLAIVEQVIRERGTRPEDPGAIRMWSAGCASGEEPYTLAIMLRELGWEGARRIIGTDVSSPRIAAARRGQYTRWALRGVSNERVGKWFSRNGTQFALHPHVGEDVVFRQENLLDDTSGGGEFDLVFCRNVMIYFDLETAARVARRLLASLAPDGYLVLGASDPMLGHLVDCAVVPTPAGIVYRKPGRAGSQPPFTIGRAPDLLPIAHAFAQADTMPVAVDGPPAGVPLLDALDSQSPVNDVAIAPASAPADRPHAADSDAVLARAAYARRDYALAESAAERSIESGPVAESDSADWIVWIRAAANQGRLTVAGELAARALSVHPLSAELQYLYATLLSQAGWFRDAELAARRALYLDQRFVMGYFALGEALARNGDDEGGRRSFRNALQLLTAAGGDDVVPASDGVTAARLRQIAALRASPPVARR